MDKNFIIGLKTRFEAKFEVNSEAAFLEKKFDSKLNNNNDIKILLDTKAGESFKKQINDKKPKYNNLAKCARMTDEISDYI